jgi:glycosyltransferase involved in cell wall biosynthesis
MIIQAYHPWVGGAERQLGAIAPLLQEQDVEVHILTRRYNRPGYIPFEIVDGVPVHRLPIPGPKALAAFTFTQAGLWLLHSLKPDVIHAHELLSPTTTAIAARRLFKTPVVAKVLRGGELGDLAKLRSRKGGQRRIELIRNQVDAFVAISQEIDQELAQIGVEPARRVFIPNGVDVERYKPLEAGDKQRLRAQLGIAEGPVAVFAGRFVPEKRIDRLVQAWPAVRRCHPHAELILLGDGEEKPRLQAMASDGVHFPGIVADVRPYFQAADIFTLPSSTEGLSNSLLEAMAAGLTCVVTPVGGALDLIRHQENGWIIPVDDETALEQAVIQVFEGDMARRQMGAEARRRILQEYALDRVAARLHSLYEGLLSVRQPEGAVYP